MRTAHILATALAMGVMACMSGPAVTEQSYALSDGDDDSADTLGLQSFDSVGGPLLDPVIPTDNSTVRHDLPQGSLDPGGAPPGNPRPVDPPKEKPFSRVEVSYDDGHPGSALSTPPSVTQRCWIPKAILADTPIYPGNPKMTGCDISLAVIGNPPTSIWVSLECNNAPGSAYDRFQCTQSIRLAPPSTRETGFISYGSGKSFDLDQKTCGAYIARALSICEATGKEAPLE